MNGHITGVLVVSVDEWLNLHFDGKKAGKPVARDHQKNTYCAVERQAVCQFQNGCELLRRRQINFGVHVYTEIIPVTLVLRYSAVATF